MTKEQERAEIAFKALSDLDHIIPKNNINSNTTAGQARRVIDNAKSAIAETFK